MAPWCLNTVWSSHLFGGRKETDSPSFETLNRKTEDNELLLLNNLYPVSLPCLALSVLRRCHPQPKSQFSNFIGVTHTKETANVDKLNSIQKFTAHCIRIKFYDQNSIHKTHYKYWTEIVSGLVCANISHIILMSCCYPKITKWFSFCQITNYQAAVSGTMNRWSIMWRMIVYVIQVQPVESVIENNGQLQQLINIECLSEFGEAPVLQVQFILSGNMHNFNIKLPVMMSKFAEATSMDSPTFFQRWKQLSQWVQTTRTNIFWWMQSWIF